jgi:CBS domain-containing protein
MKAKDLIGNNNSKMVTIGRNDTIRDAINKLTDFKIGALLVTDGNGADGIISERDILTVCSRCKSDDVCSMKIADTMTTDVIYADVEDDLMDTMETFRKNHIRHLPLRSNGKVVGMISIRDVNDTLLDAMVNENKQLMNYICGSYVT